MRGKFQVKFIRFNIFKYETEKRIFQAVGCRERRREASVERKSFFIVKMKVSFVDKYMYQ